MSFPKLPNELSILIAEHLGEKDLNSLLRTNHSFNHLLTPLLHKLAARTTDGLPAICWAAKHGHEALVRLLFKLYTEHTDMYLPFNNTREAPETPLEWAAKYGHDHVIKLLLDNSNDTNCQDMDGTAPLWMAVRQGHESTVRLLLKRAENSLLRFPGQSPLLCAVTCKREGVVRALLEHGKGILTDRSMNAPLCEAVRVESPAIIQLLVTKGSAIIGGPVDVDGIFLLHRAVLHDDKAIVEMVLDMGAEIDIQSGDGPTAMIVAYRWGNDKIAALLLERGASFFIKPTPTPYYPTGGKLLSWVNGAGFPLFMGVLLEKLLHIDTKYWDDIDQVKFFFEAVSFGHEALTRLLVGRGVDVNTRNESGDTALHVVCGLKDYPGDGIVTLLLDMGAEVQLEDGNQDTPIDVAVKHRRKTAASLLRAKMPYSIKKWVIRSAPTSGCA